MHGGSWDQILISNHNNHYFLSANVAGDIISQVKGCSFSLSLHLTVLHLYVLCNLFAEYECYSRISFLFCC